MCAIQRQHSFVYAAVAAACLRFVEPAWPRRLPCRRKAGVGKNVSLMVAAAHSKVVCVQHATQHSGRAGARAARELLDTQLRDQPPLCACLHRHRRHLRHPPHLPLSRAPAGGVLPA